MSVELVKVIRGESVESIHRGDIVAVAINGDVIFNYGDKEKRTFWRSAAKPFQVIPFIRAGGLEKFSITSKELALMTSSHGGEVKHIGILEKLLDKMGKNIDDLDCGVSRPLNGQEYIRLLGMNSEFTQGMNPCSGKHSSMIGLGVIKEIDLTNYIDKDHEIQKNMINVVSEFCEIDKNEIDIAIDGCGVPVFGMPIYNMALAYSKLTDCSEIMGAISKAMLEEPYYVAGTRRLDTIIMEETNGKVIAKLGTESVYCMAVMSESIGITIKIEDGSYRALNSLVPNLLKKHGYISDSEHKSILGRLTLEIKNHHKEVIGKYVTCI